MKDQTERGGQQTGQHKERGRVVPQRQARGGQYCDDQQQVEVAEAPAALVVGVALAGELGAALLIG